MSKIIKWVKNNPNRTMFLVPIILVAVISISHVVSWYNLANPISWAIYLSIAIEIGAMTALVAATNKIKGGVWVMFGLITFIQMIGNIFFSYKEIDVNGDLFKSWMELTSPVWEALGSKIDDTIALKRWLAFLEGGLLPIISLTSLHFFVHYDDGKSNSNENELLNEERKINDDEIVENVENDNVVKKKSIKNSLINFIGDKSLKKIINYGDLEKFVNPNKIINEKHQKIRLFNDELEEIKITDTSDNSSDTIVINTPTETPINYNPSNLDNGDYKFEVLNNPVLDDNTITTVETKLEESNSDNTIKPKRLSYTK